MVADWRSAPLRPQLRATLAFLEVLAARPEQLGPADVEAALAAGVSRAALQDAARVCALFSMIVHLADSLGWDVPPWEAMLARAPLMLQGGYELDTIVARMVPPPGA